MKTRKPGRSASNAYAPALRQHVMVSSESRPLPSVRLPRRRLYAVDSQLQSQFRFDEPPISFIDVKYRNKRFAPNNYLVKVRHNWYDEGFDNGFQFFFPLLFCNQMAQMCVLRVKRLYVSLYFITLLGSLKHLQYQMYRVAFRLKTHSSPMQKV